MTCAPLDKKQDFFLVFLQDENHAVKPMQFIAYRAVLYSKVVTASFRG